MACDVMGLDGTGRVGREVIGRDGIGGMGSDGADINAVGWGVMGRESTSWDGMG